jgi:hypothetical protein
MAKIDPQQERQRLTDFYAARMDGELEKVASQAYELTDIAREILRAELAKRGLTAEFAERRPAVLKKGAEPNRPEPPSAHPDFPAEQIADSQQEDMVTVRQFRDRPEALLAKGCLDSAGIQCALFGENMVRLDWFWSNAVGGVQLRVAPSDADAANEILMQPIPEGFDVPGVGEYQQPHCPNCQSLDVTFKELNRPASYLTMTLSVPVPIYRRAWRCHSCNVEWEDDGVPGPTESPV